MLVRNCMREHLATVEENDSIQHALSIMNEHKIRMLPVLRNGDVIGIIISSDIRRALSSETAVPGPLLQKKVHEIMIQNPITVPFDHTIEEAALILMEKGISGLPVTDDDNKIVGIIGRDEIYNLLISLSGMDKRGVELAVEIEEKPGAIELLTDVIRKYEARIASILTTYEDDPQGCCIMYLRIFDIDRSTVNDLVDELNRKTKIIYMIDHGEGRRFV